MPSQPLWLPTSLMSCPAMMGPMKVPIEYCGRKMRFVDDGGESVKGSAKRGQRLIQRGSAREGKRKTDISTRSRVMMEFGRLAVILKRAQA